MTDGSPDADAPPRRDGEHGEGAVAARDGLSERDRELVERVRGGEDRALARAISRIENRADGHRALAGALYRAATGVPVVGVTGSPGSGKSTLVEAMARRCTARGESVGVVAVDPSSPYSGGAVLGDRIRMAGLADVFVRSMSARGELGGLAAATADAVTAMDAAGVDRVFVETVGAGQNEVDVVRTADTVAVLVPPGSGDDVQMLKAGLLEVGDVFVVNKADLEGADRTVATLQTMLAERAETRGTAPAAADRSEPTATDDREQWSPPVVETVATDGTGVDELLDALDDHEAHLGAGGERERRARRRHAETIRSLLRADAGRLVERSAVGEGGVDALADRVAARETDPYAVVDELLAPLADCLADEEAGE